MASVDNSEDVATWDRSKKFVQHIVLYHTSERCASVY